MFKEYIFLIKIALKISKFTEIIGYVSLILASSFLKRFTKKNQQFTFFLYGMLNSIMPIK